MKATQMCQKVARELIERKREEEAEQQLRADGYEKQTCPKCRGAGQEVFPFWPGPLVLKCPHCDGDGVSWEKKEASPITPEDIAIARFRDAVDELLSRISIEENQTDAVPKINWAMLIPYITKIRISRETWQKLT